MHDKLLNKLKLINHHSTKLGFLIFAIGMVWFCLLSQQELNYGTYMSENALLVGHVQELFNGGGECINTYRDLKKIPSNYDTDNLRQWLSHHLSSIGLEVYSQNFTFNHNVLFPLKKISGSNLYAIMRSPSGGRTEALLITVPLRIGPDETPLGGVSLSLSLMKLLRNQIYWAKDIILLFPEYDFIGFMAWLEAYHGTGNNMHLHFTELEGRSGSIQAGLNLEIPQLHHSPLHIHLEGTNGLLANLDLVNTAVRLANVHGIDVRVNNQPRNSNYDDLETRRNNLAGLLQAVWSQASGSPTGLHGPLINFQIPAITLQTELKSDNDRPLSSDMNALGKLLEGILRSLNNLQERLHQSFWYYLLPNPLRYVSIGVYMPPILVAIGSLMLKPLSLWFTLADTTSSVKAKKQDKEEPASQESEVQTVKPKQTSYSADQEVRQRLKSTGKNTRSKLSTQPDQKSKSNAESFQPPLNSLALRLTISTLAGVLLHTSPHFIFSGIRYLDDNNSLPEFLLAAGTQGFDVSRIFAAAVVCLFFGLVLLLPILTSLLQWCLFGQRKNWVFSRPICCLSWVLFLACLSSLNISASIVLSLAIIPLLHLFLYNPNGSHAVMCSKLLDTFFAFGWLLISPPIMTLIGCYVHQLNRWGGAATTQDILDSFSRYVMQSYLEADLIGCWTWPTLAMGYGTLWMLTWTELCA